MNFSLWVIKTKQRNLKSEFKDKILKRAIFSKKKIYLKFFLIKFEQLDKFRRDINDK